MHPTAVSRTGLSGEVALITGASRGVGRATATPFAREGARVLVVARTRTELDTLVQEIGRPGRDALAIEADRSNRDQIDAMAAQAMRHFGKIDILVNNAGVGVICPITEFSEKEYDGILDVNLKDVFFASRAVLPNMLKRRKGTIINVASTAGLGGGSNAAAYHTSKWGVLGFTESLDEKVRRYNVKVCALYSGGVNTDFAVGRGHAPDASHMAYFLEAEDVARVIFLMDTQLSHVLINQIAMQPVIGTVLWTAVP